METILIVAVTLVLVLGVSWYVMRSIGAVSGRMKNGKPARAVIEGIGDTGTTISTPSIGPDAPVYRLQLRVMPQSGAPYAAETRQAIPRIFVPMITPGAQVNVLIDPANPAHVDVDFQNFSVPAPAISHVLEDASRPGEAAGSAAELVSEVRSGQVPTEYGSAAELLAKGTPGTATVTTAMPLGKKVRDVNPAADPQTLDDPLWLFTVQVQVPGEGEWPAVFGHRVPANVAAQVAPGMRLQVAVNLADRSQEVAIDWQASQMLSPTPAA